MRPGKLPPISSRLAAFATLGAKQVDVFLLVLAAHLGGHVADLAFAALFGALVGAAADAVDLLHPPPYLGFDPGFGHHLGLDPVARLPRSQGCVEQGQLLGQRAAGFGSRRGISSSTGKRLPPPASTGLPPGGAGRPARNIWRPNAGRAALRSPGIAASGTRSSRISPRSWRGGALVGGAAAVAVDEEVEEVFDRHRPAATPRRAGSRAAGRGRAASYRARGCRRPRRAP